ncbi:hypothetical protein [Streptomyces sp. NPDC127033]|uniref:hypothetical protein n=1 Tax=Streptomyces sp. NPDC127033 TaxID=3347110 RepID=UPI003657EDF3
MRPALPARPGLPASGVPRAVRAALLAAACVLLPLAGHLLAQGHAPQWCVDGAVAAVAVLGAVGLTRRRLSDAQLLSALAAAQVAYHAAYSLPGACGIAPAPGAPAPSGGGLSGAVEHAAAAGPPPWVMLTGHLVTVVIAARLLGVTEALLWRGESLMATAWQLLLFVWPSVPGERHGPAVGHRDTTAAPRPALIIRRNSGRAPPRRRPAVLPLSGPMLLGGPGLP